MINKWTILHVIDMPLLNAIKNTYFRRSCVNRKVLEQTTGELVRKLESTDLYSDYTFSI